MELVEIMNRARRVSDRVLVLWDFRMGLSIQSKMVRRIYLESGMIRADNKRQLRKQGVSEKNRVQHGGSLPDSHD